MNKKDKELLLKDISARLPYRVIVDYAYNTFKNELKEGKLTILTCNILSTFISPRMNETNEYIKPYLRPMSSMTEEEMDKIEEILGDKCIFDFMGNGDVSLHQGNFTQNILSKLYDFYNSIHVDYRGLIEKGLAIEAPEGIYDLHL